MLTSQHLTIFDNGRDLACRDWNLPHPNRVYVTGNDRQPVRVNHGGAKQGLYVAPDNFWTFSFNVVNLGKTPITVYVVQVSILMEAKANQLTMFFRNMK
jgi:hypothetical protein